MNTVKLHRLILSLKKEDKRFFKLFTKKQQSKEEVSYLKLFNYLDKTEVLDRAKFKAEFKGVKGLSGLQSYLYKLILKSLRNQPIYQDIDAILREGLADLSIFYKKKLLEEAQEKLEELLELAELHDRIFFLPRLQEWWFTLESSHFQYRNVETPLLEERIKKYALAIEQLKGYNFYRAALGRSLILLKEASQHTFENLLKIEDSLPDYDPNLEEYSLSVRVQELQFRRVLATILMDAKRNYFYGAELSVLLKKQPAEVFEVYEKFYYRALLSQLTCAPRLDIFRGIINEVEKALLENKKRFDPDVPMNIFINKIDLYFLTGDFDGFEQYVQENQTSVDFLTDSAPHTLRDFWYYKLMLYYYATQKYSEALHIFDQFLGGKEVDMMLKKPSLYLKMIIYYEEEAYLLLASFLKNTSRFLRKNKALLEPEKQLITLINKLIKRPQEEHKAILQSSKKRLLADLAQVEDSKKNFLTYFNYIGWIESQITGQPLEQLFFRHVGLIEF